MAVPGDSLFHLPRMHLQMAANSSSDLVAYTARTWARGEVVKGGGGGGGWSETAAVLAEG